MKTLTRLSIAIILTSLGVLVALAGFFLTFIVGWKLGVACAGIAVSLYWIADQLGTRP